MGSLLWFGHKTIEGLAWVVRGLKWWMWIAAFFTGLVLLCLWQHGQILQKNGALIRASWELKNASTAIRARDNLIYSTAQKSGEEWTTATEQCLEEITNAYDAGRSSRPMPGIVRDNRRRQAAGAFTGSVPGASSSGSSR